jgi:ParB family chromosome partitioning protein
MNLKSKLTEAAQGAKHDESMLADDRPRLTQLPIDAIEPDPDQPRSRLGDVSDLVASINEHGIIQPIIVTPAKKGKHRILIGERRFTAAVEAELATIPTIIRSAEEHHRLEIQVIENLHRKAFTPVEEARAYKRLIEEHKMRQEDIAKVLGKSRTSINQQLRILKLPKKMLDRADQNDSITSSILLEIAKEPDRAVREEMFKAAMQDGATVRDLRSVKTTKQVHKRTTSSRRIHLDRSEVIIRFDDAEHTEEMVIEALKEALEQVLNAPD